MKGFKSQLFSRRSINNLYTGKSRNLKIIQNINIISTPLIPKMLIRLINVFEYMQFKAVTRNNYKKKINFPFE